MIEVDGLTKQYGDKTAVDGLSFVVEPGVVTGFLGPERGGQVHHDAGLSVFAALFFVPPIVAAYLPQSIKGFAPYLPSNAGGAIWGAGKVFGGHPLSPWTGFAVRCGYAVVLTGLAAWRLRRRDA